MDNAAHNKKKNPIIETDTKMASMIELADNINTVTLCILNILRDGNGYILMLIIKREMEYMKKETSRYEKYSFGNKNFTRWIYQQIRPYKGWGDERIVNLKLKQAKLAKRKKNTYMYM